MTTKNTRLYAPTTNVHAVYYVTAFDEVMEEVAEAFPDLFFCRNMAGNLYVVTEEPGQFVEVLEVTQEIERAHGIG